MLSSMSARCEDYGLVKLKELNPLVYVDTDLKPWSQANNDCCLPDQFCVCCERHNICILLNCSKYVDVAT